MARLSCPAAFQYLYPLGAETKWKGRRIANRTLRYTFENSLATSKCSAGACSGLRPTQGSVPGVGTFRSYGEISVDNSPRPLAGEGDRDAVGEGLADLAGRKQPLTPGCAVPSPLGAGRYQLRPRS